MNILLDMDGVLADFVTSALRANFAPANLEVPVCNWEIATWLGITIDQFWANIEADTRFWHDIKPYEWFDHLISVVANYDPNFCIVTAPSRDPQCIIGKRHWLDMQFGKSFDRVMYGRQKHLMAKRGAVLIDDSGKNIEDFRLAGGAAITFPQPWNEGHASLPCDRVELVHQMLDTIATIEDAP